MTTTAATAQAPERSRVRKFLSLVMIEHSVFALPFAYIAALTAMWLETQSVHWGQLVLITIAMVSARTVAMSANRILDREFDARNPRTAKRELVTGELSVRSAWVGMLIAFAIFMTAAAALSWLCFFLAPIAVFLLVLYSFGKRFTDFPQALLALAQFVAPVGAWIAVTGTAPVGRRRARDRGRDLDRRLRPHLLLPGRRGGPADRLALVPGPLRDPRGAARVLGRARGDGRLVRLVRRRGRSGLAVVDGTGAHRGRARSTSTSSCGPTTSSRVNRAFFTANGVIGIGLFGFALADLIVHGLSA